MTSADPIQYQEILDLITPILGQEKAIIWMVVPNPMLGDVTPNEMIARGRFEKLKRFVLGKIEENE